MELNKDEVYPAEIFQLNYCGVLVFFMVVDTTYDSVCLVELKTKKIKINNKTCVTLCKNINVADNTLIIPKEMNRITRSKYWVKPILLPFENEISLPIIIEQDSNLYKEAVKNGTSYPVIGTSYAKRLKEYINIAWECAGKDEEDEFFVELSC